MSQPGGSCYPTPGVTSSSRWGLSTTKEGVLLRNVSPSLGLSDHFSGCGILNYRSDRDWSLRVCYFGGALRHF